ncbi:unnamed protein product [Arctogadus glacialis]
MLEEQMMKSGTAVLAICETRLKGVCDFATERSAERTWEEDRPGGVWMKRVNIMNSVGFDGRISCCI